MGVSYRIFPEFGLVHVRYEGFARIGETVATFEAYRNDPGFRPGQKHLVDLSRVTGHERDYPKFFAMQARMAETFHGPQSLIVFLAPTPAARAMAELAVRSWEDLSNVVPRVQETEADALDLLGLPQRSLGELLTRPA